MKFATPIILALSMTTASAHPGHPGHEDWPFDDFKMVALLGAAMIALSLVMIKRLQKSKDSGPALAALRPHNRKLK